MRKFRFRFKSIFGGKLLSAVVRLLRRRGLQLLMAAVFTGVLLVACYIYDNVPHSLLGSASVSQRYEIAKSALLGLSDKVPDDVMLVNIAYDRELVNYYDELQPEFPSGVVSVTDRRRLIAFFNQLADNPTYKYIMCDVRFEPNIDSPEVDNELYDAIARTPRLVLPMHEGEEPTDPRIFSKAGYSDYAVNFVESNFVKYEFCKNNDESFPLKAYHDLTGHTISKYGPLYVSNGQLSRKCVELKFPVRIYSDGVMSLDSLDILAATGSISGTKRVYYNLGADILDMDMDMAVKAKDKIIVIGDFSGGDNHSTYLGDMPGAVINYNALCALLNEDHIVSVTEIVFLFILYFLVAVYILSGRSVMQTFLPQGLRFRLAYVLMHHRATRWMLSTRGASRIVWSFAGITVFLMVVSAICYIFTSIIIYLFIPSILFTLLKHVVIYAKLRKTNPRGLRARRRRTATATC